MSDHRNRTACVVDNGLFTEFAVLLAQSFGRVFYYSPWEKAFATSNDLRIGDGMEGVKRIDHWSTVLNDVDLWVFPDVYHGPLQEHLVSLGKRVWGSRMGEELELCRRESKEHMKSVGIAIGPYQTIIGLDALRMHLQHHDNQFVKVSRTRGDFETFRSENYDLVEPRLDELEQRLGAKKTIMEFIVEAPIENAVEIGYDGFSVDGQFPAHVMAGLEVKDKAYIGHFKAYADMPEQLRDVNAKLAETLREYGYRNFWSTELRITRDGTAWMIDPCCRAGSPPSQLMMLMYTNLPDIMWEGAGGIVVDPIPAAEWGAQVMLLSTWADQHWQAIEFPPAVRDYVKLVFPTRIDGRYYVVPQKAEMTTIGAAVGIGDSMQEAIDAAVDVAKQVRGYYIEAPSASLADAEKELEKLRTFGITL